MSTKIKVLLFLAISLNVILLTLYFVSKLDTNDNNTKQTYKLGEASQYGYVGVKLTYDKEPVEIEIITPSGTHVYPKYADVYYIDENTKTMVLLKDTDELGEYQVTFNVKSNENINYSFVNEPSPTLRISELRLVKIDKYYYVEFTPYMRLNETDDKNCKYSITLYNSNKSFVIDVGETAINETAYVLFNPSTHAYTGESYDIRVACQTLDNKQATKRNIQLTLGNNSGINLPEQTENESENEE